jgi:thiamine pyrophosphokinase
VKTVLVLAGGAGSPAPLVLPPLAAVIAADGGAEQAERLGLAVDMVVGDLDSIRAETLASIAHVERHPVAKDATDLDLALAAALRLEPERVLVLGGTEGRLDHLLGELLLLAADAYAGVQVDAQLGSAAVHVIRRSRELFGSPGELVSLFSVHGPAHGVVTEGLRYPLRGETLEPGATLGVSNVFAGTRARITLERGVVVAVRPSGSVTEGRPDR